MSTITNMSNRFDAVLRQERNAPSERKKSSDTEEYLKRFLPSERNIIREASRLQRNVLYVTGPHYSQNCLAGKDVPSKKYINVILVNGEIIKGPFKYDKETFSHMVYILKMDWMERKITKTAKCPNRFYYTTHFT